jgi:hypothetical protein
MNLIISNSLSHNNGNATQLATLKSGWNGFSLTDHRIGIDWIKVFQPVNCSASRNICSLSDFKSNTGNTNFLSGSTINVGNGVSCSLTNSEPNNFPMHILASDEISFFGDLAFEEGTFLRAEIIDCSGGFNQFQRTTSTGEKLFLTDEEIKELEKKQHDSLMIYDQAYRDSITEYQKRHEDIIPVPTSQVDNGAIKIFPNPATDVLYISMAEEDHYDLSSIEIIDNIGKTVTYDKAKALDISFFASGFYSIKFIFTNGYIVVKSFVKQ